MLLKFTFGLLVLNNVAIGRYINDTNLAKIGEDEVSEEMCSDQFENR